MFWLLMGLTILFDVAGVIAGRLAAHRQQPLFTYLCIASFMVVGATVASMMRIRGVAVASIIWGGLTPVLAIVAGYFLFEEKLSAIQLVGAAIITIGVILIEWPQLRQH